MVIVFARVIRPDIVLSSYKTVFGELMRVQPCPHRLFPDGFGRCRGRMRAFWPGVLLLAALATGCRSSGWHRDEADRRASTIVERIGREALGRDSPYRIEAPADDLRRRLLIDQQLPTVDKPKTVLPSSQSGEPLALTLAEALQIGARHNRDYQDRKDAIFRAALNLDVEADAFRTSWAGILSGQYRDDRSADPSRRGVVLSGEPAVSRLFAAGVSVTTRLAIDLARLLTLDRETAYGLLADASVTVPLLQGAGRRIVQEPMTLAERQVIYAMYDFERFKRTFAVRVASAYLGVLERQEQIANAADNYRRLELATTRAEQLAEAGRLPATQVDQTLQDLLRARERLIGARQAFQQQLDAFKQILGLPVDADLQLVSKAEVLIRLDLQTEATVSEALDNRMPEWDMAPSWRGMPAREVVQQALTNRLDLRRLAGRVEDARRAVDVARDQLRGTLKLEAGAGYGERRDVGSADRDHARIRPGSGRYRAILQWDAPWRRVRERNRYRESLLDLARAERDYAEQEDVVKQQIRDQLRGLQQTRESWRIQQRAVTLAERRVSSTELFLQAGRAQIRDVLEAQEALVSARNALLAARMRYQTTEWGLLRDMDVLQVTDEGIWDVDETEN